MKIPIISRERILRCGVDDFEVYEEKKVGRERVLLSIEVEKISNV